MRTIRPKRWTHGMPEMERWYSKHTTNEQRQNWREYYKQLVMTGQARSAPPDSWYEQQQAAAIQAEKQNIQQQFLSPPIPNNTTANQTVNNTIKTPKEQNQHQPETPITDSQPDTQTPAANTDSQLTAIGTPTENSPHTQTQTQINTGTPTLQDMVMNSWKDWNSQQ